MLQTAQKFNKRERRRLKRQGITVESGFNLQDIVPLTENQEKAFKEYDKGKDLFLHGTAGTGKTFLGIYKGLRDVLDEKYDRLLIVRSVVPSRDMGFLPGNQQEKMAVYEAPYYEIFHELFGFSSAYDYMKKAGKVEFISTSFIRGLTFENCVVIIDECQNMAWSELNTQSDLCERNGKKDLQKIIKICQNMERFAFVSMKPDDIVRSGFVKEFIMECEKLGY
jgi:phosphate starvation-inducible protein PhoH